MNGEAKKWYVLGGILPPDYVKQPVMAGPFETVEEAQAAVPQVIQNSTEKFTNWLISECPAHLQPCDLLDVPPQATEFMKRDYPELEGLVRERLKKPELN
jgi:hypothetical protein